MTSSHPTGAPDAGSVVSIGVFDGVHRGHQVLLSKARERAEARGLPLVVLTFDPHPMSVVGPKVSPPSLASVDRRVELLRAQGADEVRVLTFDESLSQLTPEEFIERFLVEEVHAREVVVGADFRFGHRAAGTVTTLRSEGQDHGFTVTAVELVGHDDQRWSSTHARALIEAGDVAGASLVLGRGYDLDGRVVHGDHRGRELGFPTANLAWTDDPAIPADGVYAGWLEADGHVWPAAISVGTNPHFSGTERRIETYVIDRDDLDLYGHAVGVEFVDRLRGQLAFGDLDGLIAQMTADVERARQILGTAASPGGTGPQ
jgi:riboflavin kinase/FMN adenylyltransferase